MSGQTERLDKTEEIERLKEAVEFNRSVKLSEARERVCEAAVEWWRGFGDQDITADEVCRREDELQLAAGQLAKLEEQWKAS
jgi:hypothetical protein